MQLLDKDYCGLVTSWLIVVWVECLVLIDPSVSRVS